MATPSFTDKSNLRNKFKEILNSVFLFKMTKYKMNNDIRTSSQVTLTSYLTGSDTAEDRLRTHIAENVSAEKERSTCQCCNHYCKGSDPEYAPCNITIAKERDRTSSSRDPNINSYSSISELIIENLDKSVCLCEKYRNGCDKACSRAACPSGNGAPEKTAECNGWHMNYSKNITIPSKDMVGAIGTGTEGSRDSLRRRIARRARAACSRKMLLRRVPIVEWLPRYNMRAAVSDMIAGITVGLTVIPQAIAYANVAGLPPQYGLYSSFMAPFVYAALGSCKDSPVGPTAIAAILTRENLHGLGPEFAVLLCFLSGCVELLMGILQLGFLIDFISGPVSVGFTSAAAIIIATTQVKDILGLSFPGGKFLQVWAGLYEHIGETRLWDAVLGISCIIVLLLLRKVKDLNVVSKSEERSRCGTILANTLWFLSTTRNILVVVLCGGISYYFDQQHKIPFVLTGYVKPGLPSVALPPFEATVGNRTYTFVEMAGSMGSAIFVIPLLSILENIALAKVFSEGKYVDATQEMIALGLCNMASSLVDSMPVSGALSRGAVNHASGVQTTLGGVYTGVLVLVSLQFLTPYFYYIPKSSLAAVIIAAVIFMMELHVFKPIWRTKKLDIIPALVTFVSCLLLRLEYGIVLGIATNLLFLLYASARPSVRVSWAVSNTGVEYLVGSVDRSLAFPSVEFVRAALRKAAERGARDAGVPPPFVVDATHVQAADFTAAKGIKMLIDDFHARGQPLIFFNVKPSIVAIFRGVRPREFRHCAGHDQLDLMLQDLTTATAATVVDTTPTSTLNGHKAPMKTISSTVHAKSNGRT